MSSVYVTEPITSGRIIIETTYGPIDILLWCNECPITTQYFIQLCIDGYYNDMIFHRIIPNMLIQTGTIRQPEQNEHNQSTNTTDVNTKEMIQYRQLYNADYALERYPYEVNSRIRFNHRGQVAMALQTTTISNDDNDVITSKIILQPQFFITTATDAEYLNNQHVIFGTIGNSPTIFNVIRINEQTEIIDNIPVDMYHAPRITGIKIIENTIHKSIQPTTTIVLPWMKLLKESDNDKDMKKKKRKNRIGKFDMNVLSFGDEIIIDNDNEQQVESIVIKKKKNYQPMTSTTTKSKLTDVNKPQQEQDNHDQEQQQQEQQQPISLSKTTTTTSIPTTTSAIKTDHNDIVSIDHNNDHVEQKQEQPFDDKLADIISTNHVNDNHHHHHHYIPSHNNNNDTNDAKSIPSDIKSQQQEQQEVKNNKNDSDNKVALSISAMSAVEKHRSKYLTKKDKNKQQRDDETMLKLMKFKGKVCATKNPKLEQGPQQNESKDNTDTSLAARMARRVQQQEDTKVEEQRKKYEEENDNNNYYHGQILENDNANDNSDWYKTQFQCKKDSKMNGGSDGRHMDDYEVIDEKRTRSHKDHRHNKKHHHSSSKSKNK